MTELQRYEEMTRLTPEQEKAPYAHFYHRPYPEIDPLSLQTIREGAEIAPADAVTGENLRLMLHPEQLRAERGYCVLPDGTGYVAAIHRLPGASLEMYNFFRTWWPEADTDTRYKIWCPGKHVCAYYTYSSEIIGGRLEEIYFGQNFSHDPTLLGLDPAEMKAGGCVMADGSSALSKSYGAGPDARPMPGVVCHFIYEDPEGLTMRSRFWFGCQVLGGGIVNIMEPGMKVDTDFLHGIFEHNILEMAYLGNLIVPLYKQEVLHEPAAQG